MNDDKPPPLASKEVTLELTKIVGSLKHFVLGVNELLKFDHQNHHAKLQLHSRKIIDLTEVARDTLNRNNVKLYLFILCPPALLPFKSAYFKLLCMIRRHRDAFPSELDDRISRLLLPLYPNMVVRLAGGVHVSAELGIEELRVVRPILWRNRPAPQPEADSVLMPPPDVLEKKRDQEARNARIAELRKRYFPTIPKSTTSWREKPRGRRRPSLMPKQYPAGNPDAACLVPKQYPAGNPDDACLVPKQYPAGKPDGAVGPSPSLTRTKTLLDIFSS